MKKFLMGFFGLSLISTVTFGQTFKPVRTGFTIKENKGDMAQYRSRLTVDIKLKVNESNEEIVSGELCISGESGYFQHAIHNMYGSYVELKNECEQLDSKQLLNITLKGSGSKTKVRKIVLSDEYRTFLILKFNQLSELKIPWGEGDYSRQLVNDESIRINKIIQIVSQEDLDFLRTFAFKKSGLIDSKNSTFKSSVWQGNDVISTDGLFVVY